MVQGAGSSMGATFDSQQGLLVLDRAVELTTQRGRGTIQIHAQHAEFERDSQVCRLRAATAGYRGGKPPRRATRRFSFARMDRRCGWMR